MLLLFVFGLLYCFQLLERNILLWSIVVMLLPNNVLQLLEVSVVVVHDDDVVVVVTHQITIALPTSTDRFVESTSVAIDVRGTVVVMVAGGSLIDAQRFVSSALVSSCSFDQKQLKPLIE
jgi:hypothetical protein